MSQKTLVLVFICVMLVSILVWVYFKYDVDFQKDMVNVSIIAFEDNNRIKTGYSITNHEGAVIKTGNTSYSYELIQIPKQAIKVKNININEQTYYQDIQKYNLTGNTRIDLNLDEPQEVDIDKEETEDYIFLTLYSENFKDVDFCLKGSFNYLFLDAINYTEIRKLEGFEDYDSCFAGNFSLKDSNKTIKIDYTLFGVPNEKDYINISLIDKGGNTIKERIK